jgi:hypothetical protein
MKNDIQQFRGTASQQSQRDHPVAKALMTNNELVEM